jgi:FkbM family methyltransferase
MSASATADREYRPADRALAVAAFAQRHLPRGKGAVPRLLGRAVGGRPRFLVTRHGARLALAAGAWDVYATMALNQNSWDYHDFAWCLNGLAGPGVFYDIGANVGYFSIEMATRLGGAVRVVAIEPQPELAAVIAASARLNDMSNVQVIAAMAGDQAGEAELYLAPATIHASAVADSGRHPVGTARIPMVTIDDLVASGQVPPPDLVKMDVEGSEHLVLRGGRATFRTHQPHLFCEYIAEFDPGQRVRGELEALVADCPDLDLFGHAAIGRSSGRPWDWFRVVTVADWELVDSVFLRSRPRPVRDESVFEP